MKKLLPILLLLGSSSSVYAGAMTTRHQTSLQQVQTPTITTTQRTGNSYSVSGNNVNTSYTYCSAGCDGNSPTNVTVPAQNNYGVVTALPAFGNVSTTAGGYTGDLAGTIKSSGTITLTAGGAGTTATGQVTSTLTIK